MNAPSKLCGRTKALFVAALLTGSLVVHAQGSWRFDLPVQPLGDALRSVGEQAATNIFFEPKIVAGRQAPALSGAFTVEDALSRLLSGTELRYRFVDEKTIAVELDRPKVDGQKGSQAKSYMQINQTRNVETQPTTPVKTESPQITSSIEELVIVGSRLRVSADERSAPVTVFDTQRIAQLGVSNVADILDYLPQQPFSSTEEFSFGGARTARLRGLSSGNTLVLINGRRANISAAQGANNAFDLNTIPLSAVDRVEVLSGSASAVYGADAVAGVVNIVLKREVDHPQIDLYAGVADGGANEERASLSLGKAGGRFRTSVTVDAQWRASLLGSKRDLTANNDFRRFGGADLRATTTNPANISATSGNLPGLPSSFAAVPRGSAGIGMTPSDFLATAGQTNLETLNRYTSIVPETTRYSGVATAELDVTDSTAAYADLLYSHKEMLKQRAPASFANQLVPATNAFNPFGVDVRASYLLSGIGPRELEYEDESTRAVIGLRGTTGGWDWDVSVLHATGRASEVQSRNVDIARVNAALASSDPSTALNVFQDGPGGSRQLLSSLLAEPTVGRYRVESSQFAAFGTRDLFALPAGFISTAIGAEARAEKLKYDSLFNEGRDSWATYAELRLPLVSSDMRIPIVHSMNLTVAGRYDHDEFFGGSFNPQFGLEYRPTRSLLLRGSYGTSFRAPSLYEQFGPIIEFPGIPFPDLLRDNQVSPTTLSFGGNPNLDPEEADSSTLGFVFTPSTNLRFEGTYWRIDQDVRITVPSYDALVLNADLFPGRVQRAPQSPEDIALGLPGVLLYIDATILNAGTLTTSGWDVLASARWPTNVGEFGLSITGTRVLEYRAALFPTTPVVERVGRASIEGSVPKWRAASTASWRGNVLGLAVTARYISAYDDATPADLLTGQEVGAYTLLDIQGSVDFSKLSPNVVLRDLTLRAGIQNVLDQSPEWTAVFAAGYDPSQADLRQRFAYLQLVKGF